MKKGIILILSLALGTSYAQNLKPLHFSVLQSISTEGIESKNTDYRFSLNIFSGNVRNINGMEIGSFYNQNNGNMSGFQASGLLNLTKRNVNGFQIAGISNISGSVIGMQSAGISNHSQELNGIQLAGIANIAVNVNGLQVAGILNNSEILNGIQIGLINRADSVEKGIGIGLVNFYKKGGYREVEFSAFDYQNVGLSYKSGTKAIYTIWNVGYNFKPKTLISAGFGIGSLRSLSQSLFLKPELVWFNYVEDDFKLKSSTTSSHLRLGLMKKVGNNMSLSLYPSVYYSNIGKGDEGELTEISQIKPLSQNKSGRWGYGIGFGISFL